MSIQKFGPKGIESQEKKPEFIEILRVLAEGGAVHHMPTSGAPEFWGLYDTGDHPRDEMKYGSNTFNKLAEEELIALSEKEDQGFKKIYVITEKGKAYLE